MRSGHAAGVLAGIRAKAHKEIEMDHIMKMKNDKEIDYENKLESYKRVWAQVDLDAIADNMRNMKDNLPERTQMMGVIKTDGYGHGSVPIAKKLEPFEFMSGFAVATPEEAHILRLAGIKKPILVLGYSFPYSYELLAREELRPAVFRKDSIEPLAAAARRAGRPIKVHIKVDTGMNRIGITPDREGLSFVEALMCQEGIEIEGIFTHFARADEADKAATLEQFRTFTDFIHMIEEELSLKIPIKHCANSAGVLEMPQTGMDMVRAGITMYGLAPSGEVKMDIVPLKPAMSLYSHIVYVKTIHAGQSVSYGGTFTADRDMRIATVPVGYGDGYPRALSGRGHVLVHGKKAPVLGRVCMDQFMVDVSHIPEAAEGDRVVLIGTCGGERITAEELGDLSGRFNYELICDLGKRIPRVYVEGGKIVFCKDHTQDFE